MRVLCRSVRALRTSTPVYASFSQKSRFTVCRFSKLKFVFFFFTRTLAFTTLQNFFYSNDELCVYAKTRQERNKNPPPSIDWRFIRFYVLKGLEIPFSFETRSRTFRKKRTTNTGAIRKNTPTKMTLLGEGGEGKGRERRKNVYGGNKGTFANCSDSFVSYSYSCKFSIFKNTALCFLYLVKKADIYNVRGGVQRFAFVFCSLPSTSLIFFFLAVKHFVAKRETSAECLTRIILTLATRNSVETRAAPRIRTARRHL